MYKSITEFISISVIAISICLQCTRSCFSHVSVILSLQLCSKNYFLTTQVGSLLKVFSGHKLDVQTNTIVNWIEYDVIIVLIYSQQTVIAGDIKEILW